MRHTIAIMPAESAGQPQRSHDEAARIVPALIVPAGEMNAGPLDTSADAGRVILLLMKHLKKSYRAAAHVMLL